MCARVHYVCICVLHCSTGHISHSHSGPGLHRLHHRNLSAGVAQLAALLPHLPAHLPAHPPAIAHLSLAILRLPLALSLLPAAPAPAVAALSLNRLLPALPLTSALPPTSSPFSASSTAIAELVCRDIASFSLLASSSIRFHASNALNRCFSLVPTCHKTT